MNPETGRPNYDPPTVRGSANDHLNKDSATPDYNPLISLGSIADENKPKTPNEKSRHPKDINLLSERDR